jgi:hypothetical protein
MDQKSTLSYPSTKKVKQLLAKPSDRTIEFLMNFARNYSPVLVKPLN